VKVKSYLNITIVQHSWCNSIKEILCIDIIFPSSSYDIKIGQFKQTFDEMLLLSQNSNFIANTIQLCFEASVIVAHHYFLHSTSRLLNYILTFQIKRNNHAINLISATASFYAFGG
jgi:hypothetical protein